MWGEAASILDELLHECWEDAQSTTMQHAAPLCSAGTWAWTEWAHAQHCQSCQNRSQEQNIDLEYF